MSKLSKEELMEELSLAPHKTPLTEKMLHKFTYEMLVDMYFVANNSKERLVLLEKYKDYIDFGEEE